MNTETQESRTETVSAGLTPSEKWAVQLLARTEKRDISNLLRENSLNALIERGNRLVQRLEEVEQERGAAAVA